MRKNWLFRPSTLPNAPSWEVVFAFGALWNGIIERSWWATLLCTAVLIGLVVRKKLIKTASMTDSRMTGG